MRREESHTGLDLLLHYRAEIGVMIGVLNLKGTEGHEPFVSPQELFLFFLYPTFWCSLNSGCCACSP